MRAASGEPLDYQLQLASSMGVVEELPGRSFVWAFYQKRNGERVSCGVFDGKIDTDETGDFIVWSQDGTFTEKLYNTGPIWWEWTERLDNGRDRLAWGTLVIDESAPGVADNDDAPRARWVTKLVRKSDPDTLISPKWDMKIVRYAGGGSTAPQNTVAPTITGAVMVGQTVTADNGTWRNTPTSYKHQSRADGINIAGATGTTYTVTQGDLGKVLTVIVTALNASGEGVKTSDPTAAVQPRPAAPTNTTLPRITGTARVEETLTVNDGVWTGSPTLTRVWKRDGAVIAGQTDTTYTLTVADLDKAITVSVTGTNSTGTLTVTSTATAKVQTDIPRYPLIVTAPAITGLPRVGETLTSLDGTWSNSPTSYTRQWRANSAPISGATGTTYAATAQDIGKTISVTVSAINSFGTGTSTSDPVGPVTAIPSNGLDATMPVPVMALGSGKGTFPPAFDVEIPVEAQADNIEFKIERYALTALNTVADTYAGTITDAMANASAVTGLFAGVTVPSSYRMRLETLDGQRWSAWSNTIVHGDVDAPVITTASPSLKEGVKLALPLTVSNEPAGVTWALNGSDASLFEIIGSTLRILNDGVFDFEAPTDGNKDNIHNLTLTATDYSGNSASKNITVTILDADEIVDDYTFTGQTNATAGTDYSRSMTVSGLEAGYSVPITVANGLRYAINGGSITTVAGQVKNGDVVTVTMKSSSKGATTVTGSLNIGGVVRSFTIQTAIGSTPAISSVSRFPTTYLEYTKEASLDFGVGTCFFYLLTNSAAKNFKLDGVSVTSMVPATEGFLFMFDNTTAGTKKLSFELSGFYNATGIGVTVANVSTATPSLTYTPNAYYSAPITIPATTVPTDGFGLVMVSSSRALTSSTYQSNLIVDRTVADTKTNGTEFMVGSLAGAGDAKYGSLGGYYTAVTIGLAKKA